MSRSIEEIEFLARSPNRVRVLERLRDAGEMERGELREASDSVRTTLSRNLDALEERGWVRKRYEDGDALYAVTPAGRAIAERFSELETTVGAVDGFAEFYRWIPADEFDLDPRSLADAEVFVAEPGDPWTMINVHVERIKEMEESGRAALPFTGQHAVEAAFQQVQEHDVPIEFVVTEEVFETHHTRAPYAELTEEALETGLVEYHVCQTGMPYALAIIDGVVHVVAAEGEEPRALVESRSPEVREWAHAKIDEYKRQSVPKVTPQ